MNNDEINFDFRNVSREEKSSKPNQNIKYYFIKLLRFSHNIAECIWVLVKKKCILKIIPVYLLFQLYQGLKFVPCSVNINMS